MLRVPVSALRVGVIALDKATSHYLVNVHRAVPGSVFIAFDPLAGCEAQATLVQASSKAATCRVERIEAGDVPSHRLAIVQSFSKGTRLDQVVRDATALDATEIWIIATQNSAMPVAREVQGRIERWRKIAVESARQCGRGNVPKIEGVLPLNDVLRELESIRGARLVLTPGASVALWDAMGADDSTSAALLVGPEGGLTHAEREQSIAQGFREVRLGSRVLRTEVATVVALSILLSVRGY